MRLRPKAPEPTALFGLVSLPRMPSAFTPAPTTPDPPVSGPPRALTLPPDNSAKPQASSSGSAQQNLVRPGMVGNSCPQTPRAWPDRDPANYLSL